jgi:DMSO/TMAO reductase YedYZ molybdopterin-dependent catalytic subunit
VLPISFYRLGHAPLEADVGRLGYGCPQEVPVAHGAPLRLRVERQLGYKHAKYLMRIEVVDSFARIGLGNGGFWEDRGYEWYAGI